MSDKSDSFGKQLQEKLLFSMKEIREENRVLKEQSMKLNSEILFLTNHVNILEQKTLNCIEIIDVSDIKDDDLRRYSQNKILASQIRRWRQRPQGQSMYTQKP